MSAIGQIARKVAARMPRSRVLLRGEGPPSNAIALTFDDGPHAEHTPMILDCLDRFDAKATFFVQGDHATRLPHLVREIHARGHQLGNHGYSHASVRRIGSFLHVAEVRRTHRLLESIVGSPLSRCFRPPYGDWSLISFALLTTQGYQFAFWSMDSDDSHVKDSDALAAHVLQKLPAPGEILLFHEDYQQTVAALPSVLSQLGGDGTRFVRVMDLGVAT